MKIDDRLSADQGTFYYSGMSMLVRLPLEQARRDRMNALPVGTLITGYPGSPLASYDLQLARSKALLDANGCRTLPAGNEEQAVTALMGTQMLDDHPHSDYQGVTGYWYGKGPGVDRAGDALKHANFAGTSSLGAVVVLSGEDHEAKSSTMPFQQEYAYVSAGIPVLYPSSVAEFRTLGLHAVALSRYSGCWVALKLASALCDGGETVTVAPDDVPVRFPDMAIDGVPFTKRSDFSFYPGTNVDHERHLYRERHLAVVEYSRVNGLNRVVSRLHDDRIGIITAGKSAADVRQALADLGFDPDHLAGSGVALLVLGMTYPLDRQIVADFCRGLEEVVVVEEKRPFLEDAVRSALQPLGEPILVIGKEDQTGRPLLPVEGGVDADAIAQILAARLAQIRPGQRAFDRLGDLVTVAERQYKGFDPRTPNFCSGCPHSTSTVLAKGQVAFGAPGCACFNEVIEQPERHIDTMTQYGGEGLPWIGLAPFTDRQHLVQHVGDGSLYHSSYLNVRWAVATKTPITFKLLWNGAVANTGAQSVVGAHGLAALTRGLESEGVQRIVICSKDPGQYRRQDLAGCVELRGDREMVAAAEELARIDGVTVLIYDEPCANERRRRIKRRTLPAPTQYAMISEEVCENCGDCGSKSNCMSLQKVDTEFGPKTRIHESSCNQDFSCFQGECPSFLRVTVEAGTGYRRPLHPPIEAGDLADPPVQELDRPFHVYMPGVGGTGVLTINAILAFAAALEDRPVISFDQTGAAQKWGPVVSSLVLLPRGGQIAYANKVGKARADLYLALDQVAAVSAANLDRCSPERTNAVVNVDLFPTGQMIRDATWVVDDAAMTKEIGRYAASTLEVPARTITEKLLGDYMMTNMVALGVAYQAGWLPLRSDSIEQAIALNGVAVEANTAAFRYGRLWVVDPTRVRELITPSPTTVEEERRQRAQSLAGKARITYDRLMVRVDSAQLSDTIRRDLAVRLAELLDYQPGAALATRYLDRVIEVSRRVSEAAPGQDAIVEAVTKNLYKLLAYKDEYEVARLLLRRELRSQVADTFEAPVKISYNLHPPAARRLGRREKVELGPWVDPALRLLRAGRRIRGTRLDVFALQASRREERALISWYEQLLDKALERLRPLTAVTVLEIAQLPDGVRGYEEVKSRSVAEARRRGEGLLSELQRPRLSVTAVV